MLLVPENGCTMAKKGPDTMSGPVGTHSLFDHTTLVGEVRP